MVEFWACFESYCNKNGIKTDGADIDHLKDLMDKYGDRTESIKGRTSGKAR